jgi:hypothetical protein
MTSLRQLTSIIVNVSAARGPAGVSNPVTHLPGDSDDLAVSQSLLNKVMTGQVAFNGLPEEANGDTIPAAGSGLPYLSGGVLKIA